ncbi:putative transmembrane protein [Toxoplasma gondii TgCatPRC2]|uniref:Putative transmembrane protein n=1 Tax=Toxoplasma gondii TgCatPRC2 TaxID=1130821 RepID=A0A151HAX0_TOXGO|nr:putative transmembrane protein [Toxoplasma gondii TgCatPRC2]
MPPQLRVTFGRFFAGRKEPKALLSRQLFLAVVPAVHASPVSLRGDFFFSFFLPACPFFASTELRPLRGPFAKEPAPWRLAPQSRTRPMSDISVHLLSLLFPSVSFSLLFSLRLPAFPASTCLSVSRVLSTFLRGLPPLSVCLSSTAFPTLHLLLSTFFSVPSSLYLLLSTFFSLPSSLYLLLSAFLPVSVRRMSPVSVRRDRPTPSRGWCRRAERGKAKDIGCFSSSLLARFSPLSIGSWSSRHHCRSFFSISPCSLRDPPSSRDFQRGSPLFSSPFFSLSLRQTRSLGSSLLGCLVALLLIGPLLPIPSASSSLMAAAYAHPPESPAAASSPSPVRFGEASVEEPERTSQTGDDGDAGDRSVTVSDVVQAELEMLDRITADLRHSPLTAEFDAELERSLDRVDDRLSDTDRMMKTVGCFSIAHQHFTENRPLYKALVEKASPEKGMRQDEMLRLMFHGAWVACYQRFSSPDQVERVFLGLLSVQEKLTALLRRPDTPLRFSKKQHHAAEELIRRLARVSPENHKAISGFWGYTYAVVIIFLLFFSLLCLHRVMKTKKQRDGRLTGEPTQARKRGNDKHH